MHESEIIKKAEELALEEIRKYGPSSFLDFFQTANLAGVKIANELGADDDVVQIGTRLMDLKLGEAVAQGKQGEHVAMSANAAREFLAQFKLPGETVEKIVNCVEGHHHTVAWNSIEAEICANADCYKFLLPRSWLIFLHSLAGEREYPFEKALAYAEEKLEEKWKILSLDICKKELEPDYRLIRKLIDRAKLGK